MAQNATVIAAHLDDKDLKNSIDKLVQYVDEGTKKMADSFNRRVQSMRDTLVNTLGNVKLDNLDKVGAGETDSVRRTKAQQVETAAVQKTKETYDQLATSVQAAANRATTRNKKDIDYVKLNSDVDKTVTYLVNANRDVDAQLAQIMQKEQALLDAKQRETQETLALAQAQQQVTSAVNGTALGWGTVEEMQRRANANLRRGGVSNVVGGSAFQSYDDFRSALASVLRLQRQEIILANESSDSYNRISQSLKQLRAAYNSLTASERNSDQGKTLVATMHEYEQSLRRIQAQASRPINLRAALGLREDTIDDIQYKMRQLAAYRSGLDVNKQKGEIQQVNEEYTRLQKKMNEVIGKNNAMISSNNALARSWNYMKNRLAFYFTIGASTQFIKNLIDIRSQYEMNERALGILINSAERGTQIFKELSDMSLVSPYTLIELSSAAKQLVAYDIAAKNVVDTTRRLADMAAAVGVPMERLTYALGQIKAYGYLNSRDARMFANAGIPLVKQLADYYTELEGKLVTTADVYTRIKKKAIDYNDVMQVVNKMTDEGGKFFDFQAKMADTLKVRLANLTLAWNNMLNDIGKQEQGILTSGIGALRELFLHWRDIANVVTEVAVSFGVLKAAQLTVALSASRVAIAQQAAMASGVQFTRWMQVQSVLGIRLTNVIRSLSASFVALATNPTTWIVAVGAAIAHVWNTAVQLNDQIKEIGQNVQNTAKETFDSLTKFYKQDFVRDLRTRAQNGMLSQDDAKKAWEAIREQIELTSNAGDVYIRQLMHEEDLNKRVTEAFAVADRIKEASEALSEFNVELLNLKGSRLTDLDTLGQQLKEGLTPASQKGLGALIGGFFDPDYGILSGSTPYKGAVKRVEEAAHSMAEVLREELGEEGIKDKIKVADAIERIRQQIIAANPQIQGHIRDWFNIELDKYLGAELNTAGARVFDSTTNITRMVLDHVKKDTASAFNTLNDTILDKNSEWSAAQLAAIQKAINKVRDEVPPEFSGVLDRMMADLNSREWKLRILATFDVPLLDDVQKAEQRRFIGGIAQYKDMEEYEKQRARFTTLLRKNNEADTEHEKRLQEEKKKTQEAITRNTAAMKAESKEVREEGERELKLNQQRLKDIEAIQRFHNFADKEDKAAKAAQRKAESELQKALKEEISLIDKARSTYKTLTKEGVSSTEALDIATSGFGETIDYVNNVLKKYGVARFDLTKYVGTANPREIMNMLQAQLDTLARSGVVKPAEIKDLQVKLRDLRVDSVTFSQNTLVSSLNNELGKLKDEYELAVELDADPELGSIFLDTLGISKEELSELPKTAAEVAVRAQELISKALRENEQTKNLTFDLNANLNKANLANWFKGSGIDIESDLGKGLTAWVEYVNKLRTDETKKQIQEWDKLLDKYAEYETKRKRIMDEAERERQTALRQNATQDILDAINRREQQELARVDFERFQQLPTWVTATGDIANLTDKALGMLIDRLQEYKKNAKNLDPKQIKQINNALAKLYREQRKGNPFAVFTSAMDEAKERVYDYQVGIDAVQEEIDKLAAKSGQWTDKDAEKYKELIELLEKLKKEQKEVGKITLADKFEPISQEIQKFVGLMREVTTIMDELGASEEAVEIMQDLSNTIEGLNTASQGVAQIASGDILGGLTNVIKGAWESISTWFDNKNKKIDRKIGESEVAVRRLRLEYQKLEYAVEKALGTAETEARRAAIANKEAQLAEVERQLALEQQKDYKKKSDKREQQERIDGYLEQVESLRQEIQDAKEDIVNNLLGSDVKSAAEDFVNTWVNAWKQGETTLDAIRDKMNEMVENLINKAVTSRLVANLLQPVYDAVDTYAKESSEGGVGITMNEIRALASLAQQTSVSINDTLGAFYANLEALGVMAQSAASGQELSSLQQGIQGITETTANALEAYMNGVLQQVYLHSTLLTEIRDFLIPQEGDIQLDVQAQMLLQLQASYQTQEAIRSMLEGWNNASGQAVRVEII